MVSTTPRLPNTMRIPRLQLFEIEDQAWCPRGVRDFATDYLRFIETKIALHRPIVPMMSEVIRLTRAERVIDLCSGGGGPVPVLQKALAREGLAVNFTLTDRFPNVEAFQYLTEQSQGSIAFVAGAVDARAVPPELRGFRTLFNAFHHFDRADAVAVLTDAAEAGQPIGVFEIMERNLRSMLVMPLLIPLMVMLATPFIRPFRWSRLFWTHVVPLVPLVCLWDGVASQFRAYTVAELEDLAKNVAVEGYSWRAGEVPMPWLPANVTYLMGCPSNDEKEAIA